jgi:hypothetical protein
MDGRKIGYWATTGFAAAILTFGGINELARSTRIVETVAHLGYPSYLPSILGTWKLLAVLAILAPRFPRLKEWAYAGLFFDLSGALISHVVTGDGPAKFMPPLVVGAFVVASWALRPSSRVLGKVGAASEDDTAPATTGRQAGLRSARVTAEG